MLKSIIILLVTMTTFIHAFDYHDDYYIKSYNQMRYQYFSDTVKIEIDSILKYRYSKEKNQYGSKDVLLHGYKLLANEANNKGHEVFYVLSLNKNFRVVTSFSKFVDEFDAEKFGYIYMIP